MVDQAPSTNGQANENDPKHQMVLAAMMEELGVGRLDTLPLADRQDRRRHGPVPSNVPLVRPVQSETNPWQNFVPDDIDPATTEGLDEIAGGMLYRMRRGASTAPAPTPRGGHTGEGGRGGSTGSSRNIGSHSKPTHTRTPTTFLEGRGSVLSNAQIDVAIARLRNSIPSRHSPPKKALSAASRGGHHQGAVRGAHQSTSVNRFPIVKLSIDRSPDSFLAHMTYQPKLTASASNPTIPYISPTPVVTQNVGSSNTPSVSPGPIIPQIVGLAGSRWAPEVEAPIPNTPVVQPAAPVVSAMTKPMGLAGSRWAPQAENPVQTSIADSAPVPMTPISAASVVTYAPSSSFTSVAPELKIADKQVLSEQKIKVMKNLSAQVVGDINLYKTGDQSIAVFLEIVVDGSSMWNAPIEDRDLCNLKGSLLTYRSSAPDSPTWRITFQLNHHAASFHTIINLRLGEAHRFRQGQSSRAPTTCASSTVRAPSVVSHFTTHAAIEQLQPLSTIVQGEFNEPTVDCGQELINFGDNQDEPVAQSASQPLALEDLAEIAYIDDATAAAMFKHLDEDHDPDKTFLEQVLANESVFQDDYSSMVVAVMKIVKNFLGVSETFQRLSIRQQDAYIAKMSKKLVAITLSSQSALESGLEAAGAVIASKGDPSAGQQDSERNHNIKADGPSDDEFHEAQEEYWETTNVDVILPSKWLESLYDSQNRSHSYTVYAPEALYGLRAKASAAAQGEVVEKLMNNPIYELISPGGVSPVQQQNRNTPSSVAVERNVQARTESTHSLSVAVKALARSLSLEPTIQAPTRHSASMHYSDAANNTVQAMSRLTTDISLQVTADRTVQAPPAPLQEKTTNTELWDIMTAALRGDVIPDSPKLAASTKEPVALGDAALVLDATIIPEDPETVAKAKEHSFHRTGLSQSLSDLRLSEVARETETVDPTEEVIAPDAALETSITVRPVSAGQTPPKVAQLRNVLQSPMVQPSDVSSRPILPLQTAHPSHTLPPSVHSSPIPTPPAVFSSPALPSTPIENAFNVITLPSIDQVLKAAPGLSASQWAENHSPRALRKPLKASFTIPIVPKKIKAQPPDLAAIMVCSPTPISPLTAVPATSMQPRVQSPNLSKMTPVRKAALITPSPTALPFIPEATAQDQAPAPKAPSFVPVAPPAQRQAPAMPQTCTTSTSSFYTPSESMTPYVAALSEGQRRSPAMNDTFSARTLGPFALSHTAPIYQTVLIPDSHNPGKYIEVTGMVKVDSIPIVAHGPVSTLPSRPTPPPPGPGNIPFPHRRNGSDALSPLKDMSNLQVNIQNRLNQSLSSRGPPFFE